LAARGKSGLGEGVNNEMDEIDENETTGMDVFTEALVS
jgi:hypothetical protein